MTLRSDDHRAYPRAFRGLNCLIHHLITPSTERRDADNQLFEINLLDLIFRHGQANHKRETIAASKRRQGSSERMVILLTRIALPERWAEYYERLVITPVLGRNRRHELKYAF
jgi:hypothetical protein